MDGLSRKHLKTTSRWSYVYYTSTAKDGKPTLLLCHGCPDEASLWSDLAQKHLVPAGYGVIAPDLLGYGGSDKPKGVEPYSLPKVCKDVIEILDAEGVQKAIPVGHDFGAVLASRVVAFYPQRCAGVATIGTAFVPLSPYTFNFDAIKQMQMQYQGFCSMEYFPFFGSEEGPAVLDAHVEEFFTALHGGGERMRDVCCKEGAMEAWAKDQSKKNASVLPYANETFKKAWVDRFQSAGFTGPLNWYKAMIRGIDHDKEKEAVEKGQSVVDMPYLFIAALKDPLSPPAAVQPLIQQGILPDVTLAEADASHWAMLEKPAEVGKATVDWLEKKYSK